jgi:hypothetical protein
MGFTHGTPVDPGDVTATFRLPDGKDIRLKVNIIWSRKLDEHWFLSGGAIVDAVDQTSYQREHGLLFLIAVIAASLIFAVI